MAAELQAGSGITACTIDRLLIDLGADPYGRLLPQGRGVVVVVDEAGMVGTRLKENHRQVEQWEREALVDIREGRSGEAIRAYLGHGRAVVGDSAEAVRGKLVEDWWDARRTAGHGGEGNSVMVALRRSDVRDLNERARDLRLAAGELVGPQLELGTGTFSAGDEVVTGRNDRHLGVRNGTRGVVESVDVDLGELAIRTRPVRGEEGSLVVLPRHYLEDGHLLHGYAVTGHKAQGMTTDRVFVLGDDALYREWGYVALSRGRVENRLYVVGGPPTSDAEVREALHGKSALPEQRDALQSLELALSLSRHQEMAMEAAKPPAHTSAEVRDAMRELSGEQLEVVRPMPWWSSRSPRPRGGSRRGVRIWSVSGTSPSGIGPGRWNERGRIRGAWRRCRRWTAYGIAAGGTPWMCRSPTSTARRPTRRGGWPGPKPGWPGWNRTRLSSGRGRPGSRSPRAPGGRHRRAAPTRGGTATGRGQDPARLRAASRDRFGAR